MTSTPSGSDLLITRINALYLSPKLPHQQLRVGHAEIIHDLVSHWVACADALPANGVRVFAIHDLTFLGPDRGKFVGDYYYYDDIGFVACLGDTDSYGHITHWVAFTTIDSLADTPYSPPPSTTPTLGYLV